MRIFIAAFFILISLFTYDYGGMVDYWWSRWALYLWFGSIVFSFYIGKKYGILPALTLLWVMITSIYCFAWYDNQYFNASVSAIRFTRMLSAYACICFLISILIIDNLEKYYKYILNIFAIMCFCNSIYVIGQWVYGNDFLHRGGFLGNGSNNACLIAFTYPLLFSLPLKRIIKIPILLIPIVAIMCTLTSVPVGALAVSISTYLFFNIKQKYKKFISILLVFLTLFAIGYVLDNQKFFSSSNRFDIYAFVFKQYMQYGNQLLGQGLGTFHFLFPSMQQKYNFIVDEIIIWAHNDFLQLLFETGWISFILILALTLEVFLSLLKKKNYILLSCFAGWCACALFNFPLRYPIPAFFGLLIAAIALRRRREQKLFSNDRNRNKIIS